MGVLGFEMINVFIVKNNRKFNNATLVTFVPFYIELKVEKRYR